MTTNDPFWYKDALFYEVYIRAYRDANGDGHGDLKGLTEKLDYIKDLGVTCLWLLPMYGSPLRDDGYDIADYYTIHPTYGTLDDFKALLAAAHARGLRVITDLVLNHTSDQHPWFQAARASKDSPYRDYYVWSDTDQRYRDARIIFLDTETSNWTWDEQAGQYFWHRFYSSQPDLNYDNPAVRAEMLNVMRFWLDLGVDGFRADAVPYLYEREGTNCENLPETHAYLKEIRRFIDEHYPDRILLAEANQWPEDVRPYFGEGDEFHMGFHFPVMPRIYMAIGKEDGSSLVQIMRRTPPIPENCQWCTFLRNHDELTLEMVTEDERQWMWQKFAPEPRMRLNLGIRRRLAPLLDNDRRKIELANSILLTLPGSPIIYYGDEIGMGDDIWRFDRDGVRTPMQWNNGPNGGFSQAPADKLYSQPIDGDPYAYRQVNVDAQRADPASRWHTLRHMLALRQEHRVFGRGDTAFLEPYDDAILAILRTTADETVVSVNNLSGTAREAKLDLGRWAGVEVRDLLTGRCLATVGAEAYGVSLPPYGYIWLQLM